MLKLLKQGSFWVSLLLHVLLFVSVALPWFFSPIHPDKSPALDIPAYFYNPAELSQSKSQTHATIPRRTPMQHDLAQKTTQHSSSSTQATQLLKETFKKNHAVHLLGDKKVNKPLIKLLGKAISAHLFYPKIAIDLRIRGTAYVGFILHQDGSISDVQLLRSSKTEILDHAALSAVKNAPSIAKAREYIKQDEPFVFGIIFR